MPDMKTIEEMCEIQRKMLELHPEVVCGIGPEGVHMSLTAHFKDIPGEVVASVAKFTSEYPYYYEKNYKGVKFFIIRQQKEEF